MRVFWLPFVLCLLCPSLAVAQNGASDDRVSLPGGPGSLEGVGENVDIDANMGSMRYNIGIDVPAGFGAVTPSLSLSYDSGGGGSVVGMGWTMMTPCIERMTYRGLPEYDTEDDFAADSSTQLVRLPGTNPPVYRARFEGGFVRYSWLGRGDGAEGFWLAEYPDGSRGYFGADAQGNLAENARVSGDEGTFRYMLVEKVDVFGHRIRYRYIKDGHIALVSHIGYVFTEGPDSPTYEVELGYEERRDETGVDYLSDAKAGFNELLTRRLANVRVLSRNVQIRRYALSYEPYTTTGGFTRLSKVERFGADGGRFPIVFGFEYSQSFGGTLPYTMVMGNLGASFGTGRATIIDINGDALPDIVDASQEGPHRFFYNIAAPDGTSAFDTTPVFSEVGRQETHFLGEASVQVMDLNGDGFTDLVNAFTGNVLVNQGTGDWQRADAASGMAALANALIADFDGDEGELRSMKFIDYDNDKRIDAMKSTQFETTVFRNMGEEGFEVDEQVEQLGLGFAEDGLQFADMNGDGLLDVVRVRPGAINYKLNLGWGHWSDFVTVDGLPISESQVELAELEDLNGDGLADLVVVAGEAATVALNTNTTRFTDAMVFTSDDVDGIIPARESGTTILYADMNANGSSDIVWISPGGLVQVLELFPTRPNLMTKVTNGIGQIAEITYTTSAVQMALDGGWETMRHRLPYPMNIVRKLNQYELLNNLYEEVEYRYHDGFYDGLEKAFRGFERVEMTGEGDDFMEEGLIELRYEVGAEDIYRKGLLLSTATASAGRPLSLVETTYADCPLAEIPEDTDLPIRYICTTATRTTAQEGRPQNEWAVKETSSQYDGYGNATLQVQSGVTSIGAEGCAPCDRPDEEFGAPCGEQCIGDELYTETAFVSPLDSTDGRWIIHAPWRTRVYGRPGSDLYRETQTYYDGADFEGLPLSQLTEGKATRITQKVNADSAHVITAQRFRFDAHGMVIEALGPLGEPGGTTHRSVKRYDTDNLRVAQQEQLLEDPNGQPYRLRQSFQYEPRFDKLVLAAAWQVFKDGVTTDEDRLTRFQYDEYGRLASIARPDDDLETPTDVFTYELQSPVSRIIAQRRVEPGGPLTLESIACVDGRGRTFQERNRVAPGLYQVSGFDIFNVKSQPLRTYEPYQSDSAACDRTPPDGVRFVQVRYDAASRVIAMTYPDEDIYGTASLNRTEFLPLSTVVYDAADLDPDSPHAGTPIREELNGLGLPVAKERRVSADATPERMTFQYDSLGRVLSYLDQQDNRKMQTYDLLDRVLSVVDPNTGGISTFEYDDASNTMRSMDARGLLVNFAYDGLNRLVSQWNAADREGSRVTFRYDKAPEGCDEAACTNAPYRVSETTWPGQDGTRGVEHVGYDLRGRVTYRGWQMGTHRFEWQTGYDNADRATSVTYPDDQRIAWNYDDLGRVTDVPGLFDSVGYDARGKIAEVQMAHGVTTTWQRDGLRRMIAKETRDENGKMLQGFAYTHDRVGLILAIEDTSEQPEFSYEARYDYDGRSRLVEAQLSVEGNSLESLTYGYNSIDNLTTRHSSLGAQSPVHTGEHMYDPARPNAVAQVGERTMDYDSAGQMTRRGDDVFTWDYLGRLTSAQVGEQTVRNTHNALGTRVMRQHDGSTSLYPGGQIVVRDGISQIYIEVKETIVRLESDALATSLLGDPVEDGEVNSADAWQSEVDGDDARPFLWSSVRRMLLETGPEDGVTWLHSDHLGSRTMATSIRDGQASSAVEGRRSFYPYGVERQREGFVDDFGFTGQEHDPDGTVHFKMRHYDPSLGRWLSPDPAFNTVNANSSADGTVAYAYVTNDPINALDADGLRTVYIGLGFDLNTANEDPYLEQMRKDFNIELEGTKRKDANGNTRIIPSRNVGVSLHTGTTGAGLGNHVDPNGRTTFVLGSHGNLDSDGMGTHDEGFTTKEMVKLLKNNGLDPKTNNGKLVFKLQGCVTGSCSRVYDRGNSKSTAQRFASRLAKAGFKDFTVIGYTGFFISSNAASNEVSYANHQADAVDNPHDPNDYGNYQEVESSGTNMFGNPNSPKVTIDPKTFVHKRPKGKSGWAVNNNKKAN